MKVKVCPVHGCPELTPCPTHHRERSHWTQDRDRSTQQAFRAAVLTRDGFTCQRCGLHDQTGRKLDAHHLRPGNNPTHGQTLCNTKGNGCHRAVDNNAR